MEKKFVFPKVDLPEVARSNHNLDKSIMFSFSPGTARPIWARDVLPKDHWEVSFNASVESLPMLAPLYGSFKATWAFYFAPWSNYYGWMDNNIKKPTQQIIESNLLRYTLPVISREIIGVSPESSGTNIELDFYRDYNIGVSDGILGFNGTMNALPVAPSSVWEDFGWPTGYTMNVVGPHIGGSNDYFANASELNAFGLYFAGNTTGIANQIPRYYDVAPVYLHAVKPLAYLDIIRNYYVNNQLDYAEFIACRANSTEPTPVIERVSLAVLDYIFMLLRSIKETEYHMNVGWQDLYTFFNSLSSLNGYESTHQQMLRFIDRWQSSHVVADGGCFLTNYQMDLNRGLLATTVGNYKSTVDTSSGGFSIDTLRMQNKIQQLIDILDLTGGRFSDWVRALWSVDIKGDVDRPIYIGSVSQTIATTDIVSPSSTEGSKAGSQTGFAAGGLSSRKITFNSDIYGTIMCVFSYTPIVSYSNVFKREDLKTTFNGIYNPRMAQLGYQGVPRMVLNAELSKRYIYGSNDPNNANYYGIYKYYNNGGQQLKELVPLLGTARNRDVAMYDTLVGKQVAWAEYMSDIDESRGIFANGQSLEYWVLNRDYMLREYQTTTDNGEVVIEDFNGTTYIDPWKFQYLFTDTEPNAQNFRQFIKFDVFVKRPIPKRTLGRL